MSEACSLAMDLEQLTEGTHGDDVDKACLAFTKVRATRSPLDGQRVPGAIRSPAR